MYIAWTSPRWDVQNHYVWISICIRNGPRVSSSPRWPPPEKGGTASYRWLHEVHRRWCYQLALENTRTISITLLHSAPVFLKVPTFSETLHLGKRNITENVVEASGYKAESQWWAWYNNTQHCVQKLTGECAINLNEKGDIAVQWKSLHNVWFFFCSRSKKIIHWRVHYLRLKVEPQQLLNSDYCSLNAFIRNENDDQRMIRAKKKFQRMRLSYSQLISVSSSEWYLIGCDFGDIACSDRHAYQRLVRGPFRSSLTIEEEKRIKGVPDHVKHAVSCKCPGISSKWCRPE